MLTGFTCLTLIPLAQATAISFSKPIFITIGATFFLGEIIKLRRIAAIIIGFAGDVTNCSAWVLIAFQ